ncbi:MAG: hypothetical protein P4M07_03315 [Xanthobacteraceae bacterium]|nr:hypothetical protein [Xanthobacteraceae bacterium]
MTYDSASRVASLSLGMLAAATALAGVDLAGMDPGPRASFASGWVETGREAMWSLAGNVAPVVNRAAKSDRDAVPTGAAETMTVSFPLAGQSGASVVARLPAATAARSGVSSGRPAASGARKPMVACEPTVSPLAAAARNLAPGRCIT